MIESAPPQPKESPRTALVVLLAAVGVAFASARPFAGGWNDGSRLASVESLVDHHTWAIDDSIFVTVPPYGEGPPAPYSRDYPSLLEQGTGDKMKIGDHFYSDKPPVPSVLLAGWYQLLKWTTGLNARERPDLFCYWMTVASSGLAYIVAVWSIYRLGLALQLSLALRLLLTASFGLATVALPYARHVNGHIWLLGVAALLILGLVRLADDAASRRISWQRAICLGALAGLGYTLDSATGPILLVCALAIIIYRLRRWSPIALFLLGTLPWVASHHGINYAIQRQEGIDPGIKGILEPLNSNPAYWKYQGSGFDKTNLTGHWNHKNWDDFTNYAATLWIGERGFLTLNIPLWLALPAFVRLLARGIALPELFFTATWAGGTWLGSAVFSTNYAGHAISIRWFVPLLAPAYFVLAAFLRRWPQYLPDFVVLSGWGVIGSCVMWLEGTWFVPRYWVLHAMALVSWVLCWAWRSRNLRECET